VDKRNRAAPSFHKFQQFQLTAKAETGSGNLQPEIESNEYSSSKKYCSSNFLLE